MREILTQRRIPAGRAGSASQRRGDAGEEEVAAALRGLDDGYVLVRNLSLPGSNGDIDGVLIAPSGALWVLEIKALEPRRAYRCRGLVWDYQHAASERWLPMDTQPSRQALFHATQVKGALYDAGIPARPQPVVVVAGQARVTLTAPRVPVVGAPRLRELIATPGGGAGTPPQTLDAALLVEALLRAGRR